MVIKVVFELAIYSEVVVAKPSANKQPGRSGRNPNKESLTRRIAGLIFVQPVE